MYGLSIIVTFILLIAFGVYINHANRKSRVLLTLDERRRDNRMPEIGLGIW
jgi:hypothetical protein